LTLSAVRDGEPTAQTLVERPASATPESISLHEAWDLVWEEARRWRQHPSLLELSSTGQYEPFTAQAGIDGRRRGWQAVFSAKDASLLVQVFDGAVIRAAEMAGPPADSAFSIIEKPQIDSTEAVPAVIAAKQGFGGSPSKTRGILISLVPGDDDTTVILIAGQYQGRDAVIRMDGATGEIIDSKVLVPGSIGGILYSPDAGNTWQASDLTGRMVTAVKRAPGTSGCGFAAVAGATHIEIFQISDGGKSWQFVSQLPALATEWPFDLDAATIGDNDVILVGTRTGLWFSEDDGATWQQAIGLPDGPV
jgi:photosystem II stability/assembly factor-like uncharacterized protein